MAAGISYIVEPAAAPVVLHNPHLNDVIVAPRVPGLRGLLADVALGTPPQRGALRLAIDFHGGPRASLLTWLSGAPVRIGYEIAGRGWMYTRRIARPRELRPRHSVENQWDLLDAARHRAAGRVESIRWRCPPTRRDVAAVAARLRRAACARTISSSSSTSAPAIRSGDGRSEHFVELVATLAARRLEAPRRRHVRTVGSARRPARVIADARARARRRRRPSGSLSCGEFSLAELRALLDRAALYIGGDSGPLHIAATTQRADRRRCTGRRCRCDRRRGAPRRWPTESVDAGDCPAGRAISASARPGDFRCLTWITPAQVLDAGRARARQRREDA